MQGYRTETLRIGDLDLAFHLQDGDGPVAILQHGLCGDAAQPAQVFPPGTGFRHGVLECRGHGHSGTGPLERLSIATFAQDLIFMLERLGPCVLGGISMGAAIAQRIAVIRPDLVRGLILARPAWVCEAAPANMAANLAVGERLSRPATIDERDDFLGSTIGQRLAERAPDNLASLLGFFDRTPRASTAALLSRIARDGPGVTEAQLQDLRLPVLVIGHGQDEIHPLAHARRLAALIPGAELVEIPSKAQDKAGYTAAFRTALAHFLNERISDAKTRS